VSLAEDLQIKLKEVRRQLKEQQANYGKELKDLHAEVAKSTTQSNTGETESELQRLRSEVESQQTALNEAILERDAARDALEEHASSHQQQSDQAALNDAILERDAAQDSLQSTLSDLEATRTELANVKSELSDLRTVNSTLDARISDSIRKREAYWRRRVEEIENERKFMSKALMRMWGREEVGIKDPQQYAYMFQEKGSVA
jgi:DNA repair exonuclease SbcCD ATPase subunit